MYQAPGCGGDGSGGSLDILSPVEDITPCCFRKDVRLFVDVADENDPPLSSSDVL